MIVETLQVSSDKAKRQVALLGKMLLYSINHLTDEERQVYDQMVEELAAVAKTSRSFQPTQPSQPVGAGVRTPSNPPSFSSPRAVGAPMPTSSGGGLPDYSSLPQNKKMQGAKPERVVQWFVECWDKQDFKTEYFCLSDNFKQGKRSHQILEEYVNQRYERFAQRHLTGPISKQIVDVSAPVTDGDMASVQVAERHTGKDEDIILYRSYQLVFEKTAWRILDFKTNQKRVRRRV